MQWINDVVKKNVHDELFIKVNANDIKIAGIRGLVTKTQYDSDKQGLKKKIDDVDKKISNTSGLVKKTDYNTKNFRD